MKFLTEFLVSSSAPPVIPCPAPGGVIPPPISLPGHFQLSKKATLVMSDSSTQKVDKSRDIGGISELNLWRSLQTNVSIAFCLAIRGVALTATLTLVWNDLYNTSLISVFLVV